MAGAGRRPAGGVLIAAAAAGTNETAGPPSVIAPGAEDIQRIPVKNPRLTDEPFQFERVSVAEFLRGSRDRKTAIEPSATGFVKVPIRMI